MVESAQKRLWKDLWRKFNETAGIYFIWQAYPPLRPFFDIQVALQRPRLRNILLDTRTGYWYPTPEPLKSLNLKACYNNKSYLLCAMRAAKYQMKSKCPCTGGWCTSSRPASQIYSPPQLTVLASLLTSGISRLNSTT